MSGLLLLLSACDYAGDPTDGFRGFARDTHGLQANPNGPAVESDNVSRVMGKDITPEPVLPEPGNIWPALPRNEPTLADIDRNGATLGNQRSPLATPTPLPSPSSPPPSPPPSSRAPAPVPLVPQAAPRPAPSVAPPAPIASGTVLPTGQGGAVITTGNNGIMTYTLPSGASGRAIDNGNGTMTLIGNDGSVTSAPIPR